jgi:hypothetical protein
MTCKQNVKLKHPKPTGMGRLDNAQPQHIFKSTQQDDFIYSSFEILLDKLPE